jgi:inorganic pyrophosphatase
MEYNKLFWEYLEQITHENGIIIDRPKGTRFCVIDLLKKDSEIKIAIGCTEEEKIEIYNFLNNSKFMKAIMVKR